MATFPEIASSSYPVCLLLGQFNHFVPMAEGNSKARVFRPTLFYNIWRHKCDIYKLNCVFRTQHLLISVYYNLAKLIHMSSSILNVSRSAPRLYIALQTASASHQSTLQLLIVLSLRSLKDSICHIFYHSKETKQAWTVVLLITSMKCVYLWHQLEAMTLILLPGSQICMRRIKSRCISNFSLKKYIKHKQKFMVHSIYYDLTYICKIANIA